jgi:hypothetical protein
MTTWRIRIACCVPKATNTYSEHVIINCFSLQQRLHERTSVWHTVRTVVGVRFSGPIQTGPEAYPAFCEAGTGSRSRLCSFQGIALPPTTSSAGIEYFQSYCFNFPSLPARHLTRHLWPCLHFTFL